MEQRRRAVIGRAVRAPRRPRLGRELLLAAAFYWAYSLIRNAAPAQRARAVAHAQWVWRTELRLDIAAEQALNHAANGVSWLIVGMDYYYLTLHYVVTVGVLVWLYLAHPGRYAATRLVLFAATGAALAGYYLFPLAPPRLLPGGGFLDTVHLHHTWGAGGSGGLASVSNQYAAMPSMHVGWSVWCGMTVAALARPVWARVLGAAYPALTLAVIVCTANHFWLDAVGGLACLALGFGLSWAAYGRLSYRLPRLVPTLPEPAG